jgi:hypothetical protein
MPTGAIQILTGANAGKELELTKNLTTWASRVCRWRSSPAGRTATSLRMSRVPTFLVVNGAALDAHPRELKDHDVIELAGVKMEFFLKS